MTETQIAEKLSSMKKTRKLLSTVTFVAAIAAMVLLVAYNLVGVTFLQIPYPDANGISSTNFEAGYTFPGWQMVYWGMGEQYIMNDHLFDPNPIAIVANAGTLIVLIVCTALYKKGKNQSKAIKEFIAGACLLYSAVVLGFCIVPVAMTAITNGTFKFAQFVAREGVVFQPTVLAYVFGVLLLCCAGVKIYNGVFLLQQKSFAAKYAPKK